MEYTPENLYSLHSTEEETEYPLPPNLREKEQAQRDFLAQPQEKQLESALMYYFSQLHEVALKSAQLPPEDRHHADFLLALLRFKLEAIRCFLTPLLSKEMDYLLLWQKSHPPTKDE